LLCAASEKKIPRGCIDISNRSAELFARSDHLMRSFDTRHNSYSATLTTRPGPPLTRPGPTLTTRPGPTLTTRPGPPTTLWTTL